MQAQQWVGKYLSGSIQTHTLIYATTWVSVCLQAAHWCQVRPTRGCRSCHRGCVQVQSQSARATSTSPRKTFLPRGSACHTERFKVRLRSSPTRTLYWKNRTRNAVITPWSDEDKWRTKHENTFHFVMNEIHCECFFVIKLCVKWLWCMQATRRRAERQMADGGFLWLPLYVICKWESLTLSVWS